MTQLQLRDSGGISLLSVMGVFVDPVRISLDLFC